MKSDIPGQKQKQKKKKTVNVKWIVTIFFSTVLISAVFSSVSSGLLTMLRNAEKVSSFCNDVVGDICGVVSGTASASIVLLLLANLDGGSGTGVLEIAMASLVSGLTVGGKAVGKSFAMNNCTDVVFAAGRFLAVFHRGR